jgi:hypothetical protein
MDLAFDTELAQSKLTVQEFLGAVCIPWWTSGAFAPCGRFHHLKPEQSRG